MYKYYMEVLQHLNKIQILVLSAIIERVLQYPKDMLLPFKNYQALPFSIQPPLRCRYKLLFTQYPFQLLQSVIGLSQVSHNTRACK